ncbi:TIR domain-containing protein [Candidatus Pacearchaeota archaeon]|nr:TIR domain-containing protein [Candidatus Pacearchaeota archaeon]
MEIFLSWSGSRSKAFAEALHEWLPKVIQCVKPWISASDIEKGDKWLSELSERLKRNNFGIICLTTENIDEPWILFEAGALSSSIGKSRVCPILFDFEPSFLKGPLTQFQATKFSKSDLLELLKTINNNIEKEKLSETQLNETFQVWWPSLEKKINGVPKSSSKKPKRSERDMLEEVVMFTRAFSQDYFRQKWEWDFSSRVKALLMRLTPREEKIIRLVHGIQEEREYSVKEIAERFKTTPAVVKRTLKSAYDKLREFSMSEIFEPPAGGKS